MATNFTIQAGEPFPTAPGVDAQRIRVALPADRDYWLADDDYEVLSQVRASRKQDAELKVDLAQFLTYALDGDDIVIDWAMTGEDTRALEGKGGEYDMIVSDADTTDARAVIILAGRIRVLPVVTAAAVEA